ncbi:MAG: F0F1 ATP synthase subunit delta [Desulfovibrio desulfuricans]|nr:F0F1 ATP synthase subunit delta [Desulfovibrio desulfuricans]
MMNTVVARRYANAMFALGRKDGDAALNARGECLAAIGEMLAAAPALDLTLKSPVIGVEEKKALLDKLLTKLKADATLRNFCFLLADKERLAFLGEIAACYGKLLDEAKGVIRGQCVTAVKLSADKKSKLKETLQKKAGADIELTFAVDKDILGGMVLKMGDRVLDASLRAQLGILRETFKRGE